jgi:hypothetical protein
MLSAVAQLWLQRAAVNPTDATAACLVSDSQFSVRSTVISQLLYKKYLFV